MTENKSVRCYPLILGDDEVDLSDYPGYPAERRIELLHTEIMSHLHGVLTKEARSPAEYDAILWRIADSILAPFRMRAESEVLRETIMRRGEEDRAVAPPSANDDWRAKLHTAMMETRRAFSADAIAQSEVTLVNGELLITIPKRFQLDLGQKEIRAALKHLGHPALRFKVTVSP